MSSLKALLASSAAAAAASSAAASSAAWGQRIIKESACWSPVSYYNSPLILSYYILSIWLTWISGIWGLREDPCGTPSLSLSLPHLQVTVNVHNVLHNANLMVIREMKAHLMSAQLLSPQLMSAAHCHSHAPIARQPIYKASHPPGKSSTRQLGWFTSHPQGKTWLQGI